ncbi:Protein of uncharacterised function DUF262 [[Eubacterium] contortum]|uniref:Protein of uncharacterized function DUF262 n=1 Tax=Faecalicatena contorta TaxID=39482 RepID=A0A174MTU7_9FIRM|nr:DUF262 domain-containing protein [Faecalicatena contorta]CUP37119.1 Protein of uncharacterised function DUF262 [[Eubacterium] contortum] [Faecalicatena contorta]
MPAFEMNCDDIIGVFKNSLRVENTVKSISHTFLNERYSKSVDFAPYYQRKYVWDEDKATYFIESILLGTEVPPIVLFENGTKKEVIDGRQRYETIKRFLEDKIVLTEKGLKALTSLAGLRYINLPDNVKDTFRNTKIRILNFNVVNEPALNELQKDKVKKEIFRRYNSGITALKSQEIERAEYINDIIAKQLKIHLNNDSNLLEQNTALFIPQRKHNMQKRDKVNYLLSRIRFLLTLPYIPIYSYAGAKSRVDCIKTYYYEKFKECDPKQLIEMYTCLIKKLTRFKKSLSRFNSFLAENILVYEVFFWAFTIIYMKDKTILNKIKCKDLAKDFSSITMEDDAVWKGIEDPINIEEIFVQSGSHYYKSVVNRHLLVSNLIKGLYHINYDDNLRNSVEFKRIMSIDIKKEQMDTFQLTKTDPASSSIYDILQDIKESKFLIRPEYQRSETINKQKASYLLESILLDIRIPPIFIYKREDKVYEVIDGQQRLLAIIGFLGEVYKDEDGKFKESIIHNYKLSKLRILKELNGMDRERIEEYDNSLIDKILDFPIDIVEINQLNNRNFSPIDLFLRLNSKPYTILPNTFEMWNAYIDKKLIDKIKSITNEYSENLLKPLDKRMKNEELVTTLAYIDYKTRGDIKASEIVNIFIRNKRINARMNKKSNITSLLDNLTRNNDLGFLDSVDQVHIFFEKLQILTGENFENFNQLIMHKKSNVQSKTNQNFYLLWIMLNNVSKEKLRLNSNEIHSKIAELFTIVQDVPDNLTINNFIETIEL